MNKNIKNKIDLMKSQYANNKEFQEVLDKIIKSNVSEDWLKAVWNKIDQYLISWNKYQETKNNKECLQKVPGYRLFLNFKHPNLFLEIIRCRHEFKNEFVLKRNYIYSDFDQNLKDIDFEKKIKNLPINKDLKKYVDIFKTFWQKNLYQLEKFWIFLSGNPKTGKTFFSTFLANKFILKTNKKVIFIDSGRMFVEFNFHKFTNKEKLSNFYNNFIQVDLLIIDNLGTETDNLAFRDEFLNLVLNTRRNHHLPTIFISSFTFNELKQKYTFNKTKSEQIKSLIFFNKFDPITEYITFKNVFKLKI